MRSQQSSFQGAVLLLCVGAAGCCASAQNACYGEFSDAARAEIAAWSRLYVSRVQDGTVSIASASFLFSDPTMNSPLFSPLAGAVRAAGRAVTGNSDPNCMAEDDLRTPGTAAAALLAEYLRHGRIVTDLGDIDATVSHLMAVGEAQGPVELGVEGGSLISYGLPPAQVVATRAISEPVEVDARMMRWILQTASDCAALTARADPSRESSKPLTGEPTIADAVIAQINQAGNASPEQISSYQIHVLFGAYGSLPAVVVTFAGGFVLVDATNGAVDGPFAPESALDPSGLLSGHPEYANSGWSIVDDQGCGQVVSKSWKPTAPPGYTPRPAPPGISPAPWYPPGSTAPVVPIKPAIPGWWSPYICVQNTIGCACTTYGQAACPTPGTPPVPMKETCTIPICPSPAPNPPAGAGLSCTTEYFY